MKCATVEITGSETSTAAFDALPEMFRANSGNGCAVPEGVQAIAFKNPGPTTVGTGITPIACDNTKPGSGTPTTPGNPGGSGTGTPSSSSVVSAPAGSAPASSAPAGSAPTGSAKPTGTSKPTGSKPSGSPPVSSSAPPSYTPAPPSQQKPPSAPQPTTSIQAPAPSQPAAGGACTEGAVVCNADGSWSQCGSGRLQNMGKVAPGMACKNGTFGRQKRSIRFSHDHMRRRHAGADADVSL